MAWPQPLRRQRLAKRPVASQLRAAGNDATTRESHQCARAFSSLSPVCPPSRATTESDRLHAGVPATRSDRPVHRGRRRQRRASAARPPATSTTTRSGRPTARRSSSRPTAKAPPICIASSPTARGLERLTDSPATTIRRRSRPTASSWCSSATRSGGTADLWTMDLQTQTREGADVRARAATSGRRGRPTASGSRSRPIAAARCRSRTAAGSICSSPISTSIHPDGSGLKRITEHGNFCGSPKWSADSRRVHRLLHDRASRRSTNRRADARAPGNDTRIVVDRHRDRRRDRTCRRARA